MSSDFGALLSRDLPLLSKYASTLFSLVLIRHITSLTGYIDPNEQLVVFMQQMVCLFAAH